MNLQDRLLTTEEVADFLRSSVKHVRLLVRAGKLEGYRDGKRFLIPSSVVHSYLTQRRVSNGG